VYDVEMCDGGIMDFFTADHHFGHEKIIHHCSRPFESVPEMDSEMVRRWNVVVSTKDSVFILGDFFWKSNTEYCESILKQLNGHKYLLLGSHDDFLNKVALRKYFVFIKKYHEYKNGDIRAVLFHNPLFSWDGMGHGVYHFFGHVHEKYLHINGNKQTYNVGVDLSSFAPLSITEILKTVNQ
jgi:calcineurin-like phosphoesterase family protein